MKKICIICKKPINKPFEHQNCWNSTMEEDYNDIPDSTEKTMKNLKTGHECTTCKHFHPRDECCDLPDNQMEDCMDNTADRWEDYYYF